jgi:hypothetical protein
VEELNFLAITLTQLTADYCDKAVDDKNNDDVGAGEDNDDISSVQ